MTEAQQKFKEKIKNTEEIYQPEYFVSTSQNLSEKDKFLTEIERKKLELNQLEFLHIHKTARLIAASLKMGAIICEYDLETQEKLYNFGIDLGLLFQIQDDIIDETCSEEEAGKTTKNDGNKNSFVNLLGLKGAISSADELSSKCTNILETFDLNLKNSLEELLLKYINIHK